MPVTADWVILDSSALIAFFANEPGADAVQSYRQRLAIPFVTLTELVYRIWQRHGEKAAMAHYAMVTEWNQPIFWPNETIVVTAAGLKAQYHLGLADSYIAAFAKVHQAPLLTKDRDYLRLKGEIEIIPLF